ncbi:PIR protein [Plasmodium vivax]|uniref:VIR protein n=1 Tax=Plasmodium vivax TaxID=5855 RepID=A0A565A4Y3_PLAVI|nr:PIR protein [Plasmodium vivax]
MVTATTTTTTSEEKELWDKILEKSPSHNIYQKFNSDVEEKKFETCCNMFNKTENEKNSDSYKLCRKIARNADYLYDISNTSEYNSLCSHYRHWVYENIKKIIEKTKENDMISEANKFIDVRNCIMHTYRAYNCLFDFEQNELPKLENKLEEKHLYDYFSNFDTIKIDKTCKHVQIEKYKKYLTHISEIYKKHNKENHCCNGSWQENCFSYFKCNSDFDPEKLLYKLKNKGKETCEELEKEKKPTSSDISTTSHGEESDIMSTFYTGPCKNIGEGRLICSLRQSSYISPKVPHKPLKYIPEVKKDKGNESTLSDKDTSDKEFSNGKVSSQDNNRTLQSINTGSNVFNSKKIILSQPPIKKVENTNTLDLAILKTEKKPLQTVEVQEGFKWKIGQGNISCPPNNSNEDKYNLCGYVQRLKETQKSIKGLNIWAKLLENNMLSTYENINNSSQSETRHKEDSHISLDPDYLTLMSSDMYAANHSLSEEHILNSNYVRIAMVAVLTIGIIFLFFIYYKFTPLGFCLRRTFSKKKNIRSNVPSEILHPKSTKIPPKGNRKSPNRGYLVAYQSA